MTTYLLYYHEDPDSLFEAVLQDTSHLVTHAWCSFGEDFYENPSDDVNSIEEWLGIDSAWTILHTFDYQPSSAEISSYLSTNHPDLLL